MRPLALFLLFAALLPFSAAASVEETMTRVEPALSVGDAAGVLRALPDTRLTSPSEAFSAYEAKLLKARQALAAPEALSGEQAVNRDIALHLMDRRLAAFSEAHAAMDILDPVFAAYRRALSGGPEGLDALRSIPELAGRAQAAWRSGGSQSLPAKVAAPFAKMLREAAGILASRDRAGKASQALLALSDALWSAKPRADGEPLERAEYSWLLRHELGVDQSPEQISLLGQAEMTRIKARMTAIARELYPDDDLAAALAKAQSDHPETDAAVIKSYEDALSRAVDFNREHGLFREAPELKLPVVAMDARSAPGPAAFGHLGRQGVIEVALSDNDPKWLAVHNRSNIAAIAVHEGFPGHAYQFAQYPDEAPFAQFRLAYLPRTLAVEGYGFYVEKLLAERGFFTKREELGQLALELWRAARLVADTGLHTGTLSRAHAIDLMMREAFLPQATAAAEVDRYLGKPGQALAYFLGYWQIAALKEAAKTALGPSFNEADFHSAFLSFGPIPMAVIAQRIVERMRDLIKPAPPTEPGRKQPWLSRLIGR